MPTPLDYEAAELPFAAWLDTLTDFEHHEVLLELCQLANDLRLDEATLPQLGVKEQTALTHEALDFHPHSPSEITLN